MNTKNTGTPKTLKQAIENAFYENEILNSSREGAIKIVQLHVQDFLAQHFVIAMVEETPTPALEKLWDRIKGGLVEVKDKRAES